MDEPTPFGAAAGSVPLPRGRLLGRWVLGPIGLPLRGQWTTLFCSQLFVPPGHLLMLRGDVTVVFEPQPALQCNAPSVSLTMDGDLHGAWEACGPDCRGQALRQAMTCVVPEGLHVIQVRAAAAEDDPSFATLEAQLIARPLRLPRMHGL